MLDFKSFIQEQADISAFLDKINSCKTEAGLGELEKYYANRKKEVEVKDSDDITIRDAIAGRYAEIEAEMSEDEEAVEEV